MSDFAKGRADHTREELNATAERARLLGDEHSKAELGEMMQPFVIGYLRRIGGSYTLEQRHEMTQAAWLGVWDALSRWQNDGRKFSGYAYFYMHGEVQKWLAANTGVIPVPRQAWANAKSLESIVLEESDGEKMPYDLSDAELADIQFDRDAGNRRRVASAGDLFRARRDAYVVAEDFEPRGAQPAEDDHFDEDHSPEADALDAHLAARICLNDGEEELAWSAAIDFIDKHGLPIEVAERLIEEARK